MLNITSTIFIQTPSMQIFAKLREYYQAALAEQNDKPANNQEPKNTEDLDITNDATPAADKLPAYDAWLQQLLQRLPETEINLRLEVMASGKYVGI